MTHFTQRRKRSLCNSYIFCTCGPVEIPEEAFREYTKDDGPNYSDPSIIFYEWINANNSDDLRRCMVRDIVHQTKSKTPPYDHDDTICCYVTTSTVEYILIDGAGSREAFRKLLRTRPRLLNELTSEFLYALKDETKTNAGHLKSDHRKTYDCVIELLLSVLVDEDLGRQLWDYHSLKPQAPSEQSSCDKLADTFPLLTDAAQMPTWLREEILNFLRENFRYPTSKGERPEILPSSNLLYGHLGYAHLSKLFDKIPYQYEEGKLTDRDLCTILRLAEDNLPDSGMYLTQSFIIKALPMLSDEAVAFKVAKRHVAAYAAIYPTDPAILNQLRTREGRIFLYWLYGMTIHHTPSAGEFLVDMQWLLVQTETKD